MPVHLLRAVASNRRSIRRNGALAVVALVGLVAALAAGCSTPSGPERLDRAAEQPEPTDRAAEPRDRPPAGGRVDEASFAPEPPTAWARPLWREPSAIAADADGCVVGVGFREVVAVDPSGEVRWRAAVGGIGYEPPALDRDAVLVAADERFVPDRDGASVVLLDRATGAERWSVRAGALAAVALGVDRAFAVTVDGELTAYDRVTGEALWVQHLPGTVSVAGNLALAGDGRVVASVWRDAAGRWGLDALDAASGALAWREPLGTTEPPSAAVAAGDLVVVGDGSAPALRALDALDGTPRWSVGTPAPFDPTNVPAADGPLVVAADRSGTVTAVDVATGTPAWEAELGGVVLDGRPALTPDLVAVATWEGRLALIDPADGSVMWSGFPGGFPVGLAALGDVVVGSVRLGDPGRVEAWGPVGAGER